MGAETIEENRGKRVRKLVEFDARERGAIARLREDMATASQDEKQRLRNQIDRHLRMIEVHKAAMERLDQGRTATW